MEARLRRLGKDVNWHALEDQNHRFSNSEEALSYYRLLADFLKEHLALH
jgi:dipeptidyl aminopeptidase/acylaminoacyl peptidase